MKRALTPKNREAYTELKNMIFSQKLFPGQKLIYRDLEEKLNMTKTPIINGLCILEREGFVVSKKNRGFYISEVNTEETEKIMVLRGRLEEIAVEYAIEHHSNQDLKVLEQKLRAYVEYESEIYDDRRRFLDTEFHLQIAKMGKNSFLTEIIKQFYEKVYFSVRVVNLSPLTKDFKKEHKMLFEAIKNRNLGEARKILETHNLKCKTSIGSLRYPWDK
jgi:DNA-binding GntR family transcriptional regulator